MPAVRVPSCATPLTAFTVIVALAGLAVSVAAPKPVASFVAGSMISSAVPLAAVPSVVRRVSVPAVRTVPRSIVLDATRLIVSAVIELARRIVGVVIWVTVVAVIAPNEPEPTSSSTVCPPAAISPPVGAA